jgi:FkbM family methyltransferase
MSVVSYAQNFEDVILLRALRHVERGFYIDIGAQDPVHYSVTKMFYELGWRGINIEPVEHWYQRLQQDRSHDINLKLAVSDAPGALRMYEVVGTGLSTTEQEFAQRHVSAGFEVREFDVPCATLDSICEAQGVTDVHFLKVDCEGAETAAFRGFSFAAVRPWIVVVEATEPLSQEPTFAAWESILLEHGYRFVYADGLNRFYLANERGELSRSFGLPPNVFDAFVPAPVAEANKKLEVALAQLQVAADVERAVRAESERDRLKEQLADSLEEARCLSSKTEQLSEELLQAHAACAETIGDLQLVTGEVERLRGQWQAMDRQFREAAAANLELEAHLRLVLTSRSWRYTAPVRLCARLLLGQMGKREAARRVVTHVTAAMARSRLLRWSARVVTAPFPGARDRLRAIAKRGLGIEPPLAPMVVGAAGLGGAEANVALSRSGEEALLALRVERDSKLAAGR